MTETIWDVVVIGAGPAGLMAGINAAGLQKKVLVLDGQDRPGKKLLITGGGRCNVTSARISEKDYQGGAPRTIRNVLRAFPYRAAEKFFAANGVDFAEEEGKIFPSSGSAKAVLDALFSAATKAGARIELSRKITGIASIGGSFSVMGPGFVYVTRTVILATGGMSYPETGSDGSGYSLARCFGHTIVPPTPALVPLLLEDPLWNSLAGITLFAEVSLVRNGKTVASTAGPLLFTHGGISGPCVLDISRHWLRAEDRKGTLFRVNFLPDQKADNFLEAIARTAVEQPALSLKKNMTRYFPERLAEVLLIKSGLDPRGQLAHCSKKDRLAFVSAVFGLPIEISGALGYEKAEATAGGVSLEELDPKTLESRKCPGLFFAGEVLDVDGRIGGFNLHWAWASGHVAGDAAAKKAGVQAAGEVSRK